MSERRALPAEQEARPERELPPARTNDAEADAAVPADAILALQRSAGNQAVSRRLLQRDPGQQQEFVPEMSVKPDEQQALIGQTFRERLEVVNWREAPRGTSYQWGGGPRDSGIRFIALPHANSRGTSRLEAAPVRPGTSGVQANLVHQVPGGPEMTWMGPQIPVTTPTPEMEIEGVSGPPERGGVIAWDRLAVGDRITMRARVHNVDPRIATLQRPSWASRMTSDVLEVIEEHDVDPVTHEWVIEAKRQGEFNYTFDWQVPNTGMEPLETLTSSGSVEMDRALFSRRCATAHQRVDGMYDYIGAYTKDLSRMYGVAWRRHTGALKGANERRKLIQELIISGAVAFATGGVGGVIGKYVGSRFATGSYAGAFFGDAAKDLWKDTSRRLARAGIDVPSVPPFEAFPTDPSDWQNVEEARVLREAGNLKLMISQWSAAADDSPEFLTDFDPLEEIEGKMLINGVTPEALGTPPEQEVLLFEKGFWREWLTTYAHELKFQQGQGCGSMGSWQVTDNVDKPIRDRVKACASELGEDGGVWLSQWADAREEELEREAEERNEARWR